MIWFWKHRDTNLKAEIMQLRIRTETQTRVIETSNPQFVDYIANQITQGVIKTTPLKAKEPDVKIYQVLED